MLPRKPPPVLLLALLLAAAVSGSQESTATTGEDEAFTPAQLARAGERLSALYEEGMDADKDGRLTQEELAAWLARAAEDQADRDVEESWRAQNVSEGGSLDWDAYAGRRAAADVEDGKADVQHQQDRLQAEVRRAIEEASRETGLDKTGLKVSLPEMTPPPTKTTSGGGDDGTKTKTETDSEAAQQLALELARDRRRWEAADADGDGRLSRREFRDFAAADASAGSSPRMRRVVAAEALERMDADGDGRVSEAEFLNEGPAAEADSKATVEEEAKNFRDVWDADKSGHLDLDEMERMLDYLDSPETLAKEEAAAHAREAKELLAAADTDGDGGLSKAEAQAAVKAFAASAATNYGDSVGIHDEL